MRKLVIKVEIKGKKEDLESFMEANLMRLKAKLKEAQQKSSLGYF